MIQASLRDAIAFYLFVPALKGRPQFTRRYAAIIFNALDRSA
jgi:hypothetical protein